jgi:superfamily II DNA or RNA helicase
LPRIGGVWEPRDYQARAVDHLLTHACAALFISVGLGKTAITLEAFRRLKEQGVAKRMLVVAPLRVVQSVWRQEGQKWEQFRDLTFCVLHGPKKGKALLQQADIFLINPEGVEWLAHQYDGCPLPFDTVVIDELPKFKNARSKRSKALRPRLVKVARRWGLTGTPASNGYMDLFGQMLVLDDGAALGRFVTHFRDKYFRLGFTGFDYTLLDGAEKLIEERIRPYVLRMSAAEYLSLPPVIDHVINVPLDKDARAAYDAMQKEAVAAVEGEVVTAANAAAVYTKLRQIANGAVYDEAGAVRYVHDAKLDALDDLIDELAGQPLLIAYEFKHDLARMKKRLGARLHAIGSGQSEKLTNETIGSWNRGEIQLLAAHPASAGHGLNLQGSNCGNICWLGPTWDLELYSQFIGRVHRSGNTSQHIVNHVMCVERSVDGLIMKAVGDKDVTQNRLLAALSDVIKGSVANTESNEMVAMTRNESAAPRKMAWPGATESDEDAGKIDAQRHRIQEKINPPTPSTPSTIAAFSAEVKEQAERLSAAPKSARKQQAAPDPVPTLPPSPPAGYHWAVKAEVLKVAFGDPNTTLEDGLAIADKLFAWVKAP